MRLSSSRQLPLPVEMKGWMDAAMLLMGMVCSQTLPGPVSSVLNSPSPPSSLFFMPGT